jgi:hypothetical protein
LLASFKKKIKRLPLTVKILWPPKGSLIFGGKTYSLDFRRLSANAASNKSKQMKEHVIALILKQKSRS